MELQEAHNKQLVAQAVGGLALNFFLNGALDWATFPPVPTLPFWTRGNCVAFSTIGASFFMPLVTCLALTPVTRRMLAPRGPVPPIARDHLPLYARWLPENVVARGAALGLACVATIAHLVIVAMIMAGVGDMTRSETALFKAIYTALLGAVVTPLLGLRALADSPGAGVTRP